MPSPLLETKLRAPFSGRALIDRPRLTRLLAQGAGSKLTLVSAPPGFGKTSLIGGWIGSHPAAAWLSLDAGDGDRATFWTYVAAALGTAVPGLGSRARAVLEAPGASVDSALRELLNELAASAPGATDIVLVLDDLHVIEGPDVMADLAFVLERLPAHVRVVITTRADPTLPLSRLRARGELVEIRAADLRFTAEEAAAFLNGTMGLALAGADVGALEARTEGWIAALQLAALSIQGRPDAASFIASFAGDDRYVVDYLVDEVLARQPTDVRVFLLRTSVLDRMTGSLADALTGRSDAQAVLAWLDRANLFVVPLDDRRLWYRYHHLFADMLRARLHDEHPGEVAALHRRASAWFERTGQRAEAIAHALAGEDPERAADLIEGEMPALQRRREEGRLLRWLEALPASVLEARPVLGAGYAGALMQTGEFARVESLLEAVERALAATPTAAAPVAGGQAPVAVDQAELRRLPGAVAMYRAALARVGGDVEATMAHARRSLELAEADDALGHGGPAALLGLALWERGELEPAYRWFADGMASLGKGGFRSDVVGGAVTLADIRIAQGRLGDALRLYEDGLRLAGETGLAGIADEAGEAGAPPLRGAADMHVGIADVLRERNDLPGASRHLDANRALGEDNGLPKNPSRWRVAAATIHAAEGDLAAALRLLYEAERLHFADFSPDVRPVGAVRARVCIAHGRLADARAWADERRLAASDELSYVREFEHATLARLLIAEAARDGARGPLEQAIGLTGRLLAAAEAGGRHGAVIDIAVAEALARRAHGDGSAAREALARALALAEPEGHVRVFVDEGDPMRALLQDAAAHGAAAAYARRLLAAFDPPAAKAPGAHDLRAQGLVEPLSERELEVLRLLAGDLSGPQIASHLVVSLNTVRSHTKSVYAKLAVSSRRAAVRRGMELGLLR